MSERGARGVGERVGELRRGRYREGGKEGRREGGREGGRKGWKERMRG